VTYEVFGGLFSFSTTAIHYLEPTEIDKSRRNRQIAGVGTFEKAGENLVRHENGTYYLRAKVAGKCIYASLKTDSLKIAKIKRNARLEAERSQAAAHKGESRTLRDAVNALEADLVNRPNLRPKSKAACRDTIRILRDTLPLTAAGAEWSRQEAAEWWRKLAGRYSPSVANKLHGAVRKLAAILIEQGVRVDDPTRELRRMPARKKLRSMPGRADMTRIVEFIRTRKKRGCLESSRLVAFLAFTGMRKGEAAAAKWPDVGTAWLTVGADGETKGKSFRLIPISAPLKELLDAMRDDAVDGLGAIFGTVSPRRALDSACEALELPRMRVHDLRHFYATWCIESGVDIPTVAKWLGHKDGGALAMRTYGHVRDDHSLTSAAKLK
jgi:integrase